MIGVEYELAPGITAEEAAADGVRDLIVDAGYSVDVPLAWNTTEDGRRGPSSQWKPTGGSNCAGQFGSHPLPGSVGQVRLALYPGVRGAARRRPPLRRAGSRLATSSSSWARGQPAG